MYEEREWTAQDMRDAWVSHVLADLHDFNVSELRQVRDKVEELLARGVRPLLPVESLEIEIAGVPF
jgi:hypothetical protein